MSLTKKETTEALLEALNKRASLDGPTHKHHHDFMTDNMPYMEAFITKEKRKQERWEKIKVHVLGWGIVGIVGGIGTIVVNYFMDKPHP